MTNTELLIWGLLLLVGIGGSAMCSGMEVGLYTVNRVLVRVHAAGGAGGKRARLLQKQLDRPTPTLTALLVWNNIFNYAGTLALTTLVTTIGLSDTGMILIQVAVLTPVLLIFAESTPKEVFRSNANLLMERFAPMLRLLRLLVTIIPIVPVLTVIANIASKIVGIGSLGSLDDARERIAELLKFGSGGMSEAQVTLIDRALQLEHATVRSEMIPLRQAASLRSNWSLGRARAHVRAHSYSRYPVLGPKGQVVGVIHAIDLYVHPESGAESGSITALMQPPILLEAEIHVGQALKELGRGGGRMGIVTHIGREIGIVTRKDLVEPLVGEIEDW
ncbi:MAG: CNNM domain-containing protein [Phycisphaerales bacterium]